MLICYLKYLEILITKFLCVWSPRQFLFILILLVIFLQQSFVYVLAVYTYYDIWKNNFTIQILQAIKQEQNI